MFHQVFSNSEHNVNWIYYFCFCFYGFVEKHWHTHQTFRMTWKLYFAWQEMLSWGKYNLSILLEVDANTISSQLNALDAQKDSFTSKLLPLNCALLMQFWMLEYLRFTLGSCCFWNLWLWIYLLVYLFYIKKSKEKISNVSIAYIFPSSSLVLFGMPLWLNAAQWPPSIDLLLFPFLNFYLNLIFFTYLKLLWALRFVPVLSRSLMAQYLMCPLPGLGIKNRLALSHRSRADNCVCEVSNHCMAQTAEISGRSLCILLEGALHPAAEVTNMSLRWTPLRLMQCLLCHRLWHMTSVNHLMKNVQNRNWQCAMQEKSKRRREKKKAGPMM